MGLGLYLQQFVPYIFYFVGIVAAFVSIFKIEWGIFFLMPILPLETIFDKMKDIPLGKDFMYILLIAMIIGWYFRAIFNKEKIVSNVALNIPIIMLIFYTFFSLYIGSNYTKDISLFDLKNPRFETWRSYMILPLIYFIVLNNIREKNM